MFKKIINALFIYGLTLAVAKDVDLPPCPTNVMYFPQNLPMHCKMPTNADAPGAAVPPFYQSPPQNKQPFPIPIPVPPGIPGPMPLPGPIGLPGTMPGPVPMAPPGPIPMALPGGPAPKLPVIVMPFYSPDPSFQKTQRPKLLPRRPRRWRGRHKRRKPFYHMSSGDTSSSSDTDISSDTSSDLSSSEHRGWWRGRRRLNGPIKMRKRKRHHKQQLLTPVLQYQTKDGYVIFEKKISKDEARDWLRVKADDKVEKSRTRTSPEGEAMESEGARDNNSREKEPITEENIEIITKRNSHRLNKVKAYKNKAARKKILNGRM